MTPRPTDRPMSLARGAAAPAPRAVRRPPHSRLLRGGGLALLAAALLLTAGGCPSHVKDGDNRAEDARTILLDMTTSDSVDADKGDVVDWKEVVPMDDGKVTLTVRVGDPFAGHRLVGSVAVYTQRAAELARVDIAPGTSVYKLTFDAKAMETYVVKVSAIHGASAYELSYAEETKPVDPCAAMDCADGMRCEAGQCVAVEQAPPERVSAAACPGGCPRGQYCSRKRGKCLRDRCFGVKCKAGSYCSGGRCRKKKVRAAASGCPNGCPSGSQCKGSRCVKASTKKPAKGDKASAPSGGGKTGPIGATVVQVMASGSGTTVILNRGSQHNVKVGDTGKLGGVSFRVKTVYAYRCKAYAKAPVGKLASVKRAVINRK